MKTHIAANKDLTEGKIFKCFSRLVFSVIMSYLAHYAQIVYFSLIRKYIVWCTQLHARVMNHLKIAPTSKSLTSTKCTLGTLIFFPLVVPGRQERQLSQGDGYALSSSF